MLVNGLGVGSAEGWDGGGAVLAAVVPRVGRRSVRSERGLQVIKGRRPGVTNGTANVGHPVGTAAVDEVCGVATQIARIGGLQPDPLAAAGPPDLEPANDAFCRPVLTLFWQ